MQAGSTPEARILIVVSVKIYILIIFVDKSAGCVITAAYFKPVLALSFIMQSPVDPLIPFGIRDGKKEKLLLLSSMDDVKGD
jgi:hypothetical protein